MKKTMKKIALLLVIFISQSPFETFAQKMQYKNTSITIVADAFSTITGDIRYNITANFSDADTLSNIFKDYKFSYIDGKLAYASLINYQDMWNTCNLVEIEKTDVGKKLNPAIQTWLINIAYNANLFGLDLTNWGIAE